MHREPEVLEAEAQVGKWLDCRARITSKELAPLHSVKSGILQSACSTSQKMDADFGKSALVHRQVDEQPSKRSKKNGDKSAVATLKIARQLGCVFQGMEPPKSSSISRKSSTLPCRNRSNVSCQHFETRIHRLEHASPRQKCTAHLCHARVRNSGVNKFSLTTKEGATRRAFLGGTVALLDAVDTCDSV